MYEVAGAETADIRNRCTWRVRFQGLRVADSGVPGSGVPGSAGPAPGDHALAQGVPGWEILVGPAVERQAVESARIACKGIGISVT